jgi:hypothetical protein
MTLNLVLTREARKEGGDRYEAELEGEVKPWVLYVPQSISRKNGSAEPSLTITIS